MQDTLEVSVPAAIPGVPHVDLQVLIDHGFKKTGNKKVAICGTAPSSRMMANEQEPDVDIWALNDCYSFIDQVHLNGSRWFEIHAEDVWKGDGEGHIAFLKAHPHVYMLQHFEELPGSMQYPFEAIRDEFFPGLDISNTDNMANMMLGSTIDFMLALALVEGYEEIKVYGINMATDTEFKHQLPSCNFWLGMIRGRGVKLVLPESCPMLQVPIYGVTRRDHIDRDVLATRKGRLMQQKIQIEAQLNSVHGALQFCEILENYMDTAVLPELEQARNQAYEAPKLDINHAIGDVAMNGLNDRASAEGSPA